MGYRLDPNRERSGWLPEPPEATLDSLRKERQESASKDRSVSVQNERQKQTSMDETLACRCGHLPQHHRRLARSCVHCDCARYHLPGPTRVRRKFLPRDPGDTTASREKRMKGPFG
jgi:hypothetical protein